MPDQSSPGNTLHEPAAPSMPNDPETDRLAAAAPLPSRLVPNEPGLAPRGMVLLPAVR